MNTETKTYNGWSNYETWNVKLWLDNEQGDYEYWREVTRECMEEASTSVSAYAKHTGKEIFTREERAVLELSRRLKYEIEENAPELGASMWADLMNAALSEVDWHEIAKAMVDDEEWPASETEEETDANEDD